MNTLIQIVIFIVAAGLGVWWFSVIILPIFYGLPKAIFWVIKGELKASSVLVYIGTFLLWMFIFTLVAFLLIKFFPAKADYVYKSNAFFFGQWVGVIISVIKTLSKSGREDLNQDFWDAMKRHRRSNEG